MIEDRNCILVNKDNYKTTQALKQIMTDEEDKKRSIGIFSIFR